MMKTKGLQIDQRAIVTYINGTRELKAYLLHNGLTVGSVFYMNYSPSYSGLVSITLNGKMLSLRKGQFSKIEWVTI